MIHGGDKIRSGKDEDVVYGKDDFIMDQFFDALMKPGLTTKIYKRELWKNISFPEGRNHQDCYVNMRFSLLPLSYVRTSEPLYYYIIREKSITTTRTARELRQAIYLYDYTMSLASEKSYSNKANKYLKKDAINRLVSRYFEISVNSQIVNQHIYNKIIKKLLGFSLYKHILFADLPLKTRISYTLIFLNLKNLQSLLHELIGKKKPN